MSGILDLYRQDEQRALDRLADGELSDVEVRELLTMLERETDGWRRCALAFIESQALRGDLRHLQTERIHAATSSARPTAFSHKRLWSAGLALAACLLVAFSLGLWLGRENDFLRRVANPGGGPALVVENNPTRSSHDAAQNKTADDGWRIVKLNFDDTVQGKSRDIELPVRDMASMDPNWGANDPSAISAEVVQALERAGHVVKREQSLWPIELKDGRRLVVPVEQVEVQNIEYQ